MANGHTHSKITLALAVPTGIAAYAIGGTGAGIAGLLGCLMGLYVEPDLDIPHVTRSRRRLLEFFPPLGWLWVLIWWSYGRAIPHRHPLSHWPLLGTLVRILHLSGLLLMLLVVLELLFGWGVPLWHSLLAVPYTLWLAAAVGLAVSDLAHWVADWL